MNEAVAIVARMEADLAALRRLVAADTPPLPEPAPEEWLAPCQLAGRLGLGESYIRKLIKRGIGQGLPGVRQNRGRLFATVEGVRAIWDG